MVCFVQNGTGKQLFRFIFAQVPLAVVCAHAHIIWAYDITFFARERKAAFKAALLTGSFKDFRIDQLNKPISAVDHNCAAQNANLRCRKANAFGIIHGFRHVVQQCAKARIKMFYRTAFFIKACRISRKDFPFSHSFSPSLHHIVIAYHNIIAHFSP